MGSMHTGLEEEKNGFERMAAYFAERAKAEVGLIVTGGIAPNRAGWVAPFGAKMTSQRDVKKHRLITEAVHQHDGKICMQILHSGRYGYHPFNVAPSKIKSPITPFTPKALSQKGIENTIKDFINSADLAKQAGYDGVEIMGSEGYLINQFIVSRTNKRTDEWGGTFENRIKLALKIVSGVREKVGEKFIIIYRLSMLDLVDDGNSWEEVVLLAKEIEKAGATIINTGIGWHEARIPTIATMVPRAGFAWVTKKMMGEVSIPLVTTNRINGPETAEKVLSEGCADLISMARPFLADPELMLKSRDGNENEINTCIACNQACLDHVFENKTASCLVNPRACHETLMTSTPAASAKNIAVVGAGPAGLTFAIHAAERGHKITLFEKNDRIGGQFDLAQRIPGKEEFKETLRYFNTMLIKHDVDVRLHTAFEQNMIEDYDEVVFSTGVSPRSPKIEGLDHASVLSYPDAIMHPEKIGEKVAIIGAGGIGFDTATMISQLDADEDYFKFWGIDKDITERGGMMSPSHAPSPRQITVLKRSPGKAGKNMGKTTGWAHRAGLKKHGVTFLSSVTYQKIDDEGIHFERKGVLEVLEVDSIIVCAGQVSNRTLYDLVQGKDNCHLIGGAHEAKGIDAKRAIAQAYALALKI